MLVKPLSIADDLHLDLAPRDVKRSEGLHMSDLYNRYYQVIDPKRYRHGEDEDAHLKNSLLGMGMAIEQYTERLLIASGIDATRPPEFQTEDEHKIYFSPDLLIVNGTMRGGEIKATFMSTTDLPTKQARSMPDKFDKYQTQMKVYGHNLEIPEWLLIAWFLKGDYKKRQGVDFFVDVRAFLFQFTAKEMADEYKMLLRFGKTEKML